MLTSFSSEDLGRVFDPHTLTKGRSLVLLGAVEVTLADSFITAVVDHGGHRRSANITPSLLGRRVAFSNQCSCGQSDCLHLAAAALAALDRYPALRKPVQSSFLDALTAAPAEERQVLTFMLSPGEPPHACFVSPVLIGERTGTQTTTTPADILASADGPESNRLLASLLGGGGKTRSPVAASEVNSVLGLLARTGRGRWQATGKTLSLGEERSLPADLARDLPPRSGVIMGDAGGWYVDGATGAVGRVRARQAPKPPAPLPAKPNVSEPTGPTPRRLTRAGAQPEPVILDCPLTPVLRLRTIEYPDDFRQQERISALMLDFDYDGVLVSPDDERQFVRVQPEDGSGSSAFVRRD